MWKLHPSPKGLETRVVTHESERPVVSEVDERRLSLVEGLLQPSQRELLFAGACVCRRDAKWRHERALRLLSHRVRADACHPQEPAFGVGASLRLGGFGAH